MPASRIALLASTGAMDLDTDGPLLFPALEAAGIEYDVVAWDDPKAKWHKYSMVVIRATWDYFKRTEDFLSVLAQIDLASELRNPLEVIEWNIDKRYLRQLAADKLPTVATAFVSHLSPPTELGSAMAQIVRWGSDEVVVKPTVSEGSNDTFRLDASDGSAIARSVQAIVDSDRVAMLQPYLAAIDADGERGCVYVNGQFDHAFRKEAILAPEGQSIDGLFAREQISAVELSASEQMVADRTNSWLTNRFGPLLYSRIDLFPSDAGPLIGEVELIEPGLFFEADPPSAQRFADALR